MFGSISGGRGSRHSSQSQSIREIAFQKNSYFPHVSGMGEYCVRQTSRLLFKCRCKFSDTGVETRKGIGAHCRISGFFVLALWRAVRGTPMVCRVPILRFSTPRTVRHPSRGNEMANS